MLAVSEMMATPPPGRGGSVERIDLDEDAGDWPEDPEYPADPEDPGERA